MRTITRLLLVLLALYLLPSAFGFKSTQLRATTVCPGEKCCFELGSICNDGAGETANAYYSATSGC